MPPVKTNTSRATAVKYTRRKRKDTQQTLIVTQGELTLSQPLKKKGRGPGQVADSTHLLEKRPVVWPIGQHEFTCAEDPREIVKSITRLALTYMPGPLRSFHAFEKKRKDAVERAFLERFTYRENENPDKCREVLEAIAGKRYGEEMNKARNRCFKAFGWNLEKWKGMVPHWCLDPKNWHGLCDIFATDEWQGLSNKNKSNRTTSGLTVAHYGGSASMHQHQGKLTTMLNGTEPTMEQLYLHTHCKLPNGKSPVVAQVEASILATSQTTDNGDGNGLINPSTEGTAIEVDNPFDTNSLKFTNERAQNVYAEVIEKKADEANADKDEGTLFIDAVGGVTRGRVRGFGSVLDKHVSIQGQRERLPHAVSSVSGVTTLGERTFTESEWRAMLEERDRRQDEEREERKRAQANNNHLFSQLFSWIASNQNIFPAGAHSFDKPDEVVAGNMPSLQDLATAIREGGQGGPYQALLNMAQTGQEAASGEASMNTWFGPGN